MTHHPPLHVIGVGPWGQDVAGHLAVGTPGACVTLLDLDASPTVLPRPPARARVLAATRPAAALASALDDEAHATSSPFLLVVMDHPHLHIGPAVAPGHGACFHCWSRRLRQHSPAPDVDAALERHFAEHPAAVLAGYPPPSAALAAALAAPVIERLEVSPEVEGGSLRSLDMVTLRLRTGRGVGVHGCPRCGLGREEPERSHMRLRAAMADALGWAA